MVEAVALRKSGGLKLVSATVSQAVFQSFVGAAFALASFTGRQVLADTARLAELFAAMLHTRTAVGRGVGRSDQARAEYQQHKYQ